MAHESKRNQERRRGLQADLPSKASQTSSSGISVLLQFLRPRTRRTHHHESYWCKKAHQRREMGKGGKIEMAQQTSSKHRRRQQAQTHTGTSTLSNQVKIQKRPQKHSPQVRLQEISQSSSTQITHRQSRPQKKPRSQAIQIQVTSSPQGHFLQTTTP